MSSLYKVVFILRNLNDILTVSAKCCLDAPSRHKRRSTFGQLVFSKPFNKRNMLLNRN
jgi:hypothetical protein